MRTFVCLVVALAFSVSTSAPARAQQPAPQGSSSQIAGFPFPASIGGYARGAREDYPETGDSGFSVHYTAKSGGAFIFIYDRGKDLSSATPSDLAEEVSRDLRSFQAVSDAAGLKPSITEVSVKATSASARINVTLDKSTSFFIFITIVNGKFVKIHYSTSEQKDASKLATRFRDDYLSRLKSLH